MIDFSSGQLVLIHLAHSLAFSVCLLTFARSELSRSIFYWISSNLLGVLGFAIIHFRGTDVTFVTFLLPNALNFIGGAFRVLAVMRPVMPGRFWRWETSLLALSAGIFLLALIPSLAQYRLLFVLLSAIPLPIAATIAVLHNPLWVGSAGQKWLVVFFGVALLGFGWRLTATFPIGQYNTFIGQSAEQYAGLVVLLVVSFFLQIGYVVLVSDRLRRNVQLTERRASRAQERARQLAQRRKVAENLAQERLKMLNILTHEVRQPLNNAQAALQSMLAEIEPATIQRDKLRSAAERAQAVLDDITLALSNAIVGAMVVQRKQEPALHECEVLTIAELARTDCPKEQSNRIIITVQEHNLFLAVDPILLRLSIRNLLHNAIKFSPEDSVINFAIKLDSNRLGVSFSISNELAISGRLDPQIVKSDPSQIEWPSDGRHLGLFVVAEIARVHHGTLSLQQPDSRSVTFEIFIPK